MNLFTRFAPIAALALLACSGTQDTTVDAGTTKKPDAGTVVDAGTKVDAGLAADAGATADAGSTRDAGEDLDAGSGFDGSTPDVPVGAACNDDSTCGDGYCIPEEVDGEPTGFTGGYCTVDCDPAAPASCPVGSVCYEYDASDAECLKSCTASSECRESENYECDADDTCYPLE